MTPGFVPYPLGEKLAISQLPRICDLGGGLRLAGVEAEQSGYGGNHVGHGKAVGASRHDVGTVKFYGGESDAAVFLADTRLDQGSDEGLDGAAGWAPRSGPEGQERGARR